jgi:hypothetical protein
MSCKIFPPEIPIKNCKLPKYLPQQFGPYYDDDPNSVIKYKNIPTYLTSQTQIVETFDNVQYNNYTAPLVAMCIIIVFLLLNKWIISTFT